MMAGMPEDAPPPDAPAGELRERVWAALMRARAAAYPLPVHGHHPNFRGAGEAAERLVRELLARGLRPGQAVLSYPDYVLKPLRSRLLRAGVPVIVPAQHGGGWRRLEPGRVDPARASSIAGAEREGEAVAALPPLRLAAVALVAVADDGAWLGKGYGFALPAAAAGLPAVALAHPLQRVPRIATPDGRLALWATPDAVHVPNVENPSAGGLGPTLD